MGKKHYTTGQLAALFQVAPRTVSKWFDSGALEGFRIPGSQDRRVPSENAEKFARENGIYVAEFERALAWMLFVSGDTILEASFKAALGDINLRCCSSGFEAGLLIGESSPALAIVDLSLGAEAHEVIRVLGKTPFAPCVTVAILPTADTIVDRSLVRETYKKPLDGALLAERIRGLLQLA
jgi:hypothetical protein